MKKEILVGSAALTIILIGIIVYALTSPTTAKTPAPSSAAAPRLPATGAYVEHGQYYDIVADYPTTTPLAAVSAAANDAALAAIQNGLADEVAQFKKDGDFANLTPHDVTAQGLDQGRKYTENIRYLIGGGPRTVSYIFTVFLDTLGAHPNLFFKTFTFDTASGKELALGDVFASESDYLGALSKIAREKLPDIIGKDGAVQEDIQNGTTPEAKNFADWFFDNADFVILFPPYQVAAYAAGPQTVRIPVKSIDNILQPQYRQ